MKEHSYKLQIFGEDSSDLEELLGILRETGWNVHLGSPDSYANQDADLILLAVSPSNEGASLIRQIREVDPVVSILVLSSHRLSGTDLFALGAAGAYDCISLKDASKIEKHFDRLEAAAARCAHRRESHAVGEGLVGDSDKMAQVRRYIQQASAGTANILVLGETGTGKEVAARAIHRGSEQASGPFIAINCAAIPENLLESELFGHERGAFTGADRMRKGAFEIADGGSLFLDEIGEMPPAFQAKLLRVVQPPPGASALTREFTRVGGEHAQQAQVRLIAATNIDLDKAVAAGDFREDLLERIRVISIFLPPLRERREDIPSLVDHFLQLQAEREGRPKLQVDTFAMEMLKAWEFSGNVRELEAALRSIASLKFAGDTIVLGDLPQRIFQPPKEESARSASPLRSLEEVEQVHIRQVLDATGGNKSRAASILGISRPTLDRKLEKSSGPPE